MDKMIKAITEYQCPGCVRGGGVPANTCPKFKPTPSGCQAQVPGTIGFGIGVFALGLKKGFCRYGKQDPLPIEIYPSYEVLLSTAPNLKTIFSVPVWKHLDEKGNTLMRWYSPRTNAGWTLIILGDARNHFPTAIEVTEEDISKMD